ncbi:AEC family transporter [Streptomyces sp. H39-S7]|uniref:AEC family transporter n=1 Tax=Streptomyces sp. H39-S7 TaxID=3004357 RepID=UPI0022B00C04|nr:AEC family transporter [Streptomyces sp. H39-S7]MCZ4123291.1 AEC family transporter [Streptomyces sp. H39-S7]
MPYDERSTEALVMAYVEADGSSDDPAEATAYAAASAADPERVRALHDRRADRLERNATWGTRAGALPYHRERGADPGGRGRTALSEALRLCTEQAQAQAQVHGLGVGDGAGLTAVVAHHHRFAGVQESATSRPGAPVPRRPRRNRPYADEDHGRRRTAIRGRPRPDPSANPRTRGRMNSLLACFAPIWILTAAGYLVSRTGLLGEQAEPVLGRFVFHVAMPAALFVMISKARLDTFANTSMIAFAAGTVAVCALGLLTARRLFHHRLADQAVSSMAAGYVNSANLGIPVALQVLGDASFVAQILLFQVLLISPVILTLLDAGTGAGNGVGNGVGGKSGGLTRMLLMPVRNPIIMASALGAVVSAAGWRLPTALGHSCELLGAAAVPTALLTLGMSLHGRPAATGPGQRLEVGVTVALKTLVQPLIALAVGGLLLHLPRHQLLAVVLCSALPTAQNAFIYARQYDLDTGLARDSVMVSTLVSMATLSIVYWTLGPSHP